LGEVYIAKNMIRENENPDTCAKKGENCMIFKKVCKREASYSICYAIVIKGENPWL